MVKQKLPCLRQDLLITTAQNPDNLATVYTVTKPNSGESFQFGEEEFFLCKSLDGKSTTEEIIANFQVRFGIAISDNNFADFLREIKKLDLLEISKSKKRKKRENDDDDDDDDFGNQSQTDKMAHWSILKNPEPIFTSIVITLKPLYLIFKLISWGSIPLFLISLTLWINEQLMIQESLNISQQLGSFITSFLWTLLSVNFVTKVGRSLVATYYGAKVKDFGLRLRWGFMPQFYAKVSGINRMNRNQQLFIYASPLLFRNLLFIIATFIWYFNVGKGNILSAWGILFAAIGLVSLIVGALPLTPLSPGTRIVSILFNKSPNYSRKLMGDSLSFLFNLQQRQESLSIKEILIVITGLAIVIGLSFIVVKIAIRFALGLTESFPNIFGRGTFYLILFGFLILGFNFLKMVLSKTNKPSKINSNPLESLSVENENNDQQLSSLNKKIFRGFLLLLCLVILAIPIPYSIGGTCQLLPPKQQKIQSTIAGKIDQVFYRGGDGILIKKGTVIASIVSGDVQNETLTLQEQIKKQQAQIEENQINLKKLRQGNRQEEIEIVKAQVEVARQEVDVASSEIAVAQESVEEAIAEVEVKKEELKALKQQLDSAIVKAEYSEAEMSRLSGLYQEGAFSLQRWEDSKEQAETDRINVAEKRQNLATQKRNIQQIQAKLAGKRRNLDQVSKNFVTKQRSWQEAKAQLNLVLSGTLAADIEIAQQQIQGAFAELKRLQQELKYAQEKTKSSKLVMPFDGYLVDSYLDQKIGSYLNQGETFATIQDNSNLIAELEIPEYDAGEIKINAPAEVKLLAYPNTPVSGKVVAVEPAAGEEENAVLIRVFSVQIELEDSNITPKPGMSGYGKIQQDKKPILIVFTRPLVRFLQIEFWSWLP